MYPIDSVFIDFGPLFDFDEPVRVLKLVAIEDDMCTFNYLDGTFACHGHADSIFDDMGLLCPT